MNQWRTSLAESMSGDMSPCLAVDGSVHRSLRYTKLARQGPLRDLSFRVEASHLSHHGFRQFGLAVLPAAGKPLWMFSGAIQVTSRPTHSPLLGRVRQVSRVRAEKEMGRIHTFWSITFVAHEEMRWDGLVRQGERNAMGPVLSALESPLPIALTRLWPCPEPALAWVADPDAGPKLCDSVGGDARDGITRNRHDNTPYSRAVAPSIALIPVSLLILQSCARLSNSNGY